MPTGGIKPYLAARILTKRADFLRVKTHGSRASSLSLALQYLADPTEPDVAVGFTCAKRSFGTGVASNRGRRRLKAAWQQAVADAKPGYLYVVVGKLPVLDLPFPALVAELKAALARVPPAAPATAQP
ncbi:MAG: ribonuclease P protein component [Alphaproteobacteria bacterium]|jgi:ribonuclease P protein component|nr:ribonuclease P protein component [Alphaproteobacteria bacterium]